MSIKKNQNLYGLPNTTRIYKQNDLLNFKIFTK